MSETSFGEPFCRADGAHVGEPIAGQPQKVT